MSRIKGIAAAVLVIFASGCLFSAVAFAKYGSGLDRYPQKILKESFVKHAEQKITERLDEYGEKGRREIVLTGQPSAMRCPAGKIELSAKIPREIRYGGITPVYVSVMVDGKLFRRVVCYYRVTIYDNVVVASHDLSLEKQLTADDFRVAEKEIAGRAEEYLTDVSAAVGKVPARVIHEGTAITKNLLQNPLIVEVGAPITIVSNRSGVRITVEGVALSRGREGSIIRVRNNKSRKIMRARIIDANTAEIL